MLRIKFTQHSFTQFKGHLNTGKKLKITYLSFDFSVVYFDSVSFSVEQGGVSDMCLTFSKRSVKKSKELPFCSEP